MKQISLNDKKIPPWTGYAFNLSLGLESGKVVKLCGLGVGRNLIQKVTE